MRRMSEQRDDPAFRNLERDALQHEDHMIVDDLDAVDRQADARRRMCG